MSKFFILLITLPLLFSGIACGQASDSEQPQAETAEISEKVEVYYFHFTRRCASCVNVQKATERVLVENFKEDIDNGTIVYHEINLSEPESRELAKTLEVNSQGLIVVNGKEKLDLTMQGFMYASRDYDRFRKELEEAIFKLKG